MAKKIRHTSWLEHRNQHSYMERTFAESWAKECEPKTWVNHGFGVLQDLFITCSGDGGAFRTKLAAIWVNGRDAMVAATVVQWLGTACGFSWLCQTLKRCGYDVRGNELRNELEKEDRREWDARRATFRASSIKDWNGRRFEITESRQDQLAQIEQLVADGMLVVVGTLHLTARGRIGTLRCALTLKARQQIAAEAALMERKFDHIAFQCARRWSKKGAKGVKVSNG